MKFLSQKHWWISVGVPLVQLSTFILRKGLRYLTQSRLWIALGAPSVNLGAAILLGIPPSLPMMTIQFLACYAIYSLNVVSDLKEDTLGNPTRAAFARRFSPVITLGSLLCVALAIGLAWPYGVRVVLGALIPFLIGLGYGFGCIPIRLRPVTFLRLKDIPFIKNVTVGGTWALTAVVLQADGTAFSVAAASACVVLIALRFFITSILPDLRDAAADQRHGVKTIPVVCGKAFTLRLTQVLNLLFAICVLVSAGFGIVQPVAYTLLFFVVYGGWYIFAIARRGEATPFICDVIVDGEHILFGLILFFSQQFMG